MHPDTIPERIREYRTDVRVPSGEVLRFDEHEGLEDADLDRLVDAIRGFRPDLCESVQSSAPDPPTQTLTTLSFS